VKLSGVASDRVAAGFVLAGVGVTMVSCNVWHDVHAGMPGYLAWLAGFAPVVTAMGLSLAIRNRHIALKIIAAAVMIGAMGLSLEAAGTMVRPAFGPLWWLFGPVGDLAALIAFHVIVTPAAAPEPVMAPAPEAAPAPAPAVPRERSPRPAPRRSGSGRRSAPADDLTLEARALGLLGAHPEMSGAALGRELGVHESYGRKLRNRLAPVDDSNSNAAQVTDG
jgi:hypothetical protein